MSMINDQLWSIVGKILALIAGIVGIIKIFEYFTSPKGKLAASVQKVPFVLPEPPKDAISDLLGYKSMYIVVVRNSGNTTCDGTTLVLKDAAVAKINRIGTDTEYRKLKDGIIELGSVKPREEIQLEAWTKWNSLLPTVSLSYATGVGRVLRRR